MKRKRRITAEQIAQRIVKKGKLPRHVAIIMDGNGRWAEKRGLPRAIGHKEGVTAVKRVVRAAARIELPYLTIFAFSRENWKRPRSEVSALMKLLEVTVRREIGELHENNVRLITTGRIDELSPRRKSALEEGVRQTAGNTGLVLNLVFNYSGRDDILRAVKRLVEEAATGRADADGIDEERFDASLMTADLPEPDLIVRTSGEMRISNFFLWQAAYAELYFTSTLWPDFEAKHLYEAIEEYQRRERRFGSVG
jgi:undecaprenyl diphosphate synthase